MVDRFFAGLKLKAALRACSMPADDHDDAIVIGTSSDEEGAALKRRRSAARRQQVVSSPESSFREPENAVQHAGDEQHTPQSFRQKQDNSLAPDSLNTGLNSSKSAGGKKSKYFTNFTTHSSEAQKGNVNPATPTTKGSPAQQRKRSRGEKTTPPKKMGQISEFFSPRGGDTSPEGPARWRPDAASSPLAQSNSGGDFTSASPEAHWPESSRFGPPAGADGHITAELQQNGSLPKEETQQKLPSAQFQAPKRKGRGLMKSRTPEGDEQVDQQGSKMEELQVIPDTESESSLTRSPHADAVPDSRTESDKQREHSTMQDVSSPSQKFLTPPGKLGTGSVEAEVARLNDLNDEDLLVELPELPDLQSLALMSLEERKNRIRAAVLQRPADEMRFRESLGKQMQENRDKKRQAQQAGSPIQLSPWSPAAKKHAQAEAQNFESDEDDGELNPTNVRIALWEPPASGSFLIEEVLYNDPWKLLVACMLLNKTTARAVRKIVVELFTLCPTPEQGKNVDVEKVEAIIKPLGLFRKRAVMFKRFSQEYCDKEWTDPQQLHGIGRYAADAYYMFCRNKWRERSPPADKDLRLYYDFLVETDGQGRGFEREIFDTSLNGSATSL